MSEEEDYRDETGNVMRNEDKWDYPTDNEENPILDEYGRPRKSIKNWFGRAFYLPQLWWPEPAS